ncbi:MAG: SMC-Scp complex subunit ScpB [Euryarchaeota archaeon]|nr:SMC-Scp complex subunit ScpB [Euryarchaeota archaeon]
MKNLIEAVLFVATDPVSVEEINRVTGLPADKIVAYIEELMDEYRRRDGGLEIMKIGDRRYAMQARDEYAELLKDFVKPAVDGEVLKTLAYIALKQPVLQAEVVRARGYLTYEHVRTLVAKEFITAEPSGRSKLLKTTPKFADYFNFPRDIEKLKRILGEKLSEGM